MDDTKGDSPPTGPPPRSSRHLGRNASDDGSEGSQRIEQIVEELGRNFVKVDAATSLQSAQRRLHVIIVVFELGVITLTSRFAGGHCIEPFLPLKQGFCCHKPHLLSLRKNKHPYRSTMLRFTCPKSTPRPNYTSCFAQASPLEPFLPLKQGFCPDLFW